MYSVAGVASMRAGHKKTGGRERDATKSGAYALSLMAAGAPAAALALATLCLIACSPHTGGYNPGPLPPVYTVGGSVSGLEGSGLLLRNNDGDDLAISADGSFTFALTVISGGNYSVTVATEPHSPSQSCTVGNASGVATGNISSVTVECTTNRYTVGGSVSGLSGTGLVLRDNGGDDLDVAASGSFVFATPLASGAAYSVTVATQPSAPAQSCTVTGAAGSVAGGNVTSVVVACVIPAPPPPVAILPAGANVAAGGSQQFTASLDGNVSTAVTWKVNGVVGGSAATGTVSAAGLYNAPKVAATAVLAAVSNADPGKSAQAPLTVLAPHRIAVRTGADGLAELYDRVTGNSFTARGNNYIRLATLTSVGGGTTFYHSTFNVGLYDAARAEAALALMQTRGFNATRVFVTGCCVGSIGDPAGGLSTAYLANLVDFLERAKQHGVFVIITQDAPPAQGGYDASCAQDTFFQGYNLLNLCAGGVAANRLFEHDLVQALVSAAAPLEAILAFELRNEYYYDSTLPPLSLASGSVTAANGSTYDMSDVNARQRMMDEGLTYYTDQVGAAAHEVDPTALVTVGFFWPQTPNPTRIGDTRLISVYPAMASSSADFIDIHGYVIPGDLSIDQLMQNYALTGHQQTKPVLMGEFGAFHNQIPLIGDAAAALKAWQIGGCPYHLRGWLLWTWDDTQQPADTWSDQATGGQIDQALAPAVRADPCAP